MEQYLTPRCGGDNPEYEKLNAEQQEELQTVAGQSARTEKQVTSAQGERFLTQFIHYCPARRLYGPAGRTFGCTSCDKLGSLLVFFLIIWSGSVCVSQTFGCT
jgi:hypothetical protein